MTGIFYNRVLSARYESVSQYYLDYFPFGLQTLKLARVALVPFGTMIVDNPESGGCLRPLLTVIWWFVGGIPIALTHLLFGALFCLTIIGIPFGLQHFKLAGLAFTPFGKVIL